MPKNTYFGQKGVCAPRNVQNMWTPSPAPHKLGSTVAVFSVAYQPLKASQLCVVWKSAGMCGLGTCRYVWSGNL